MPKICRRSPRSGPVNAVRQIARDVSLRYWGMYNYCYTVRGGRFQASNQVVPRRVRLIRPVRDMSLFLSKSRACRSENGLKSIRAYCDARNAEIIYGIVSIILSGLQNGRLKLWKSGLKIFERRNQNNVIREGVHGSQLRGQRNESS